VRASHVPDVTARTLGDALEKAADRRSALHTGDSLANLSVGKDFAEHRTVAHTLGEYVSNDGEAHTQTVEAFFAIIKRGITGSFHSVSEQHLQRYVDEFAFRWNTARPLASKMRSAPRSFTRPALASVSRIADLTRMPSQVRMTCELRED
jgi:ISXO2-like transposase domain